MQLTTNAISANIKKGAFKPHTYLSNVCLSHFQSATGFVSGKMFPTVPVPLSTSHFYEFNKDDLARDDMAPKPDGGKVAPSVFGHREKLYKCEVHQILTNIDQIATLDFQRSNAPKTIDPRKMKAITIADKMNLHQDILWANKYFNADSWATVYQGVSATPQDGEFYHFDSANSDPVEFISKLSTRMVLSGLRRPNKMCVGAHVMAALKTNTSILERIKYQGSESNPAHVTANVLAQLFGLDEIVVSEAVVNKSDIGQADNFEFVCSSNDLLLVYTTSAPSLEEPSAGYTFTWDMLGNGNYTPVQQFEGRPADHTEFVEGLIATDHQITCPDLGVFLKGVVSSDFTV